MRVCPVRVQPPDVLRPLLRVQHLHQERRVRRVALKSNANYISSRAKSADLGIKLIHDNGRNFNLYSVNMTLGREQWAKPATQGSADHFACFSISGARSTLSTLY